MKRNSLKTSSIWSLARLAGLAFGSCLLAGNWALAAETVKTAASSPQQPSLVSARVMDMQGKPLKQISMNQAFQVEYTVKNLDQKKVDSLYSDYKVMSSGLKDKAFNSLDEACQQSQNTAEGVNAGATVKMYPQSQTRVSYNQVVSEKVQITAVNAELTRLTMKFNPLKTTACRMSAELKNKIVIPGMIAWVESENGFEDLNLNLKQPLELALIDSDSKAQ